MAHRILNVILRCRDNLDFILDNMSLVPQECWQVEGKYCYCIRQYGSHTVPKYVHSLVSVCFLSWILLILRWKFKVISHLKLKLNNGRNTFKIFLLFSVGNTRVLISVLLFHHWPFEGKTCVGCRVTVLVSMLLFTQWHGFGCFRVKGSPDL